MTSRIGRRLYSWATNTVMIVLACACIAFGLVQVFKRPLVERLLTRIFWADLTLEGVELDFYSQFPRTCIRVAGLSVASTNPAYPGTCLRVARGEVEIDLYRFFTSDSIRRIRRIALDSAFFDIHTDAQLRRNNLYFKAPPGQGPRKRRTVVIEQLTARDFSLRDHYAPRNRTYDFVFDTVGLGLTVSPDSLYFVGNLEGRSRSTRIGNYTLLVDRPVGLAFDFTYAKADKWLAFRGAQRATIDGTEFLLRGGLRGGDESFYDVRFAAPQGKLSTLLSFVPVQAGSIISQYQVAGQFEIEGQVYGTHTPTESPYMAMAFACADGRIAHARSRTAITAFRLEGLYSNGTQHSGETTQIEVTCVEGRLDDSPFEAQLTVANLTNPELAGGLLADMHLPDLAYFLGLPEVGKQLAGRARLDLRARGSLADFGPTHRVPTSRLDGVIAFDSAGFVTADERFDVEDLTGEIRFDSGGIHLAGLTAELNHQHVEVRGQLNDFVAFLTQPDAPFTGHLLVRSPLFDVQELLTTLRRTREARAAARLERLAKRLARGDRKAARLAQKQAKARRKAQPIPGGPSPNETRAPRSDTAQWLRQLARYFVLPSNSRFDLVVEADTLVVRNQRITPARVVVQFRNRYVGIPRARLELPGGHFALVSGEIRQTPDRHTTAWLELFTGTPHLDELLAALQLRKATGPIPDYGTQLTGVLRLDTEMKPRLHRRKILELPDGFVQLSLRGGQLVNSTASLNLQHLGLHTRLTWHEVAHLRQTPLHIQDLTGSLNTYPFRARVTLWPDTARTLEADLEAQIDVSSFLTYFSLPFITAPTGVTAFGVRLRGSLDSLRTRTGLTNFPQSGWVDVVDAGFTVRRNGQRIHGLNGRMTFDEAGIQLENLCGELGPASFGLEGRIYRFLDYLYTPNAPLNGYLRFTADTLSIENLLAAQPVDSLMASRTRTARKPSRSLNFRLPQASQLFADLEIDYIRFKALEASRVVARASVIDRVARLDSLAFRFCEGQALAHATIDARPADSLRVDADFQLAGLNVQQVFSVFRNFNQTLLTDTNLTGRLEAQLALRHTLPTSLAGGLDGLRLDLDFNLTDATLHRFKPLQKLHPLVHRKYLVDVPFRIRGENLFFENQTLHVPALELRSNLFHAFVDGFLYTEPTPTELDFRLSVRLLNRSFRLLSRGKDPFTTLAYNRSVLNFTITGTDRKPVVAYDTRRSLTGLARTLLGTKDELTARTRVRDKALWRKQATRQRLKRLKPARTQP